MYHFKVNFQEITKNTLWEPTSLLHNEKTQEPTRILRLAYYKADLHILTSDFDVLFFKGIQVFLKHRSTLASAKDGDFHHTKNVYEVWSARMHPPTQRIIKHPR